MKEGEEQNRLVEDWSKCTARKKRRIQVCECVAFAFDFNAMSTVTLAEGVSSGDAGMLRSRVRMSSALGVEVPNSMPSRCI